MIDCKNRSRLLDGEETTASGGTAIGLGGVGWLSGSEEEEEEVEDGDWLGDTSL